MKPPKKAHIAGGARAGRTAPSLSRTRSVPAGAVFQSLVTRRGRTHRYPRVLYLFAEMLTANWFGSISDKVGRKRVIVTGSAWAMGMVLLYPLTQDTFALAAVPGL